MKSNSRIFKHIRHLVNNGDAPENFRTKDVIIALGTSISFLSKHSYDLFNAKKNPEGNGYFIRVGIGLYKINPLWR